MNYRYKNAPTGNKCKGAFIQNVGSNNNMGSNTGCGCVNHTVINENNGCSCQQPYNSNTNSIRRERTPMCEMGCKQGNDKRIGPRKYTCGQDNGYLQRTAPIAMVYSPMQKWRELYDPHTALMTGTIFKELDLPFYPTPCKRKENSQCQCR